MSGRVTVRLPGWVDALDEAVDAAWEPLRGVPVLNQVFYGASAAADFSALWHAINVARLASGRTTPATAARVAVAIGADSLLVNQGIKRLFERDRPEADATERPHHLRQPSTSSFPSGHASSAVVAASLFSPGSALAPAYRALAGVVATSRLHVRIHHASDVAAGAAVGWMFSKAIRRWSQA